MDKGGEKAHERVYTNKVRAGRRRTYFFDVRQTRGSDYYITLTESTKRFDGDGFTRHKIFLYKEDFNRFVNGLQDAINHVKNELMPEYDYEEYDRRQEEWEKTRKAESAQGATESNEPESSTEETNTSEEPASEVSTVKSTDSDSDTSTDTSSEIDDDMEW